MIYPTVCECVYARSDKVIMVGCMILPRSTHNVFNPIVCFYETSQIALLR
jgi:hypothetical protein